MGPVGAAVGPAGGAVGPVGATVGPVGATVGVVFLNVGVFERFRTLVSVSSKLFRVIAPTAKR